MNSNDVTVVMKQHAAEGVFTQTPLHHADLSSLAETHSDRQSGIVLTERALTGQLMIRVRGELDAASSAVQSAIGIGLPERLQFNGNPLNFHEPLLAWMSPDEWRLCCPYSDTFDCETKLRTSLSQVPGASHAIVNNSGGFTVLDLSGQDVLKLLKKSTAYDVRDSRFPIGKVVGTSFAKTSVTLLRTGDNSWQLWVRRSFADYVWLWLQDAAREYGLMIAEV